MKHNFKRSIAGWMDDSNSKLSLRKDNVCGGWFLYNGSAKVVDKIGRYAVSFKTAKYGIEYCENHNEFLTINDIK